MCIPKAMEDFEARMDPTPEISHLVDKEIFIFDTENLAFPKLRNAAVHSSSFVTAASKSRTDMHVPRQGTCVAAEAASVYVHKNVR